MYGTLKREATVARNDLGRYGVQLPTMLVKSDLPLSFIRLHTTSSQRSIFQY